MRLAISERYTACISREIWTEYADVLFRPKFQALRESALLLLRAVEARAKMVEPLERIDVASDPDDNRFLECAVAGGARFLITGNRKHYPAEWGRTRVVNAREFLLDACPEQLVDHSYRSASIGSSRDALMAGSSPETSPTSSSMIVDVNTANRETLK